MIEAGKLQAFLEYLRITAFEEFTDGDDEGWDHATNFAVTVGSKMMDMLDLDVDVRKG
jgi:hypothetical protein